MELLRKKSEQFKDAVKPGRTHLQDAAPVTFGIELLAETLFLNMEAIQDFEDTLSRIPGAVCALEGQGDGLPAASFRRDS